LTGLVRKIDFIDDDLCHIALYAVFVGVVAVRQPAFDGNLASFVEEFLGELGLLFPQNDLVPGGFGYFLPFRVLAIAIGGQVDLCEFLFVFSYFDFGCAA